MTIRDSLEMGPENDPASITPDPNQVTEQPTETPADAGVSALDEKAFIEDQSYQVAWNCWNLSWVKGSYNCTSRTTGALPRSFFLPF